MPTGPLSRVQTGTPDHGPEALISTEMNQNIRSTSVPPGQPIKLSLRELAPG